MEKAIEVGTHESLVLPLVLPLVPYHWYYHVLLALLAFIKPPHWYYHVLSLVLPLLFILLAFIREHWYEHDGTHSHVWSASPAVCDRWCRCEKVGDMGRRGVARG
jgi:hypothetical protein